MVMYVDTSVLALALLDQEGASPTIRTLDQGRDGEGLVSSELLRIELHRVAHRTRIPSETIDDVLGDVELVTIGHEVIESGCHLAGELKSLDALHLATALLLDDPRDPVTFLTHDARLGKAADRAGLRVVDAAH